MKHTAVGMLISRLPNIDWSDPYYRDILNEAVDKEREQIVDAYDSGLFDGSMNDVNDRLYKQYYNETYKINEQ